MTRDSLNPRSRVAQQLTMSAKRACWMARLCEIHLELCGNDPDVARRETPCSWGTIDNKSGSDWNPRKYVKLIWGEKWWFEVTARKEVWPWIWDQYWKGNLEQQVKSTCDNLPKTSADSIMKEWNAPKKKRKK